MSQSKPDQAVLEAIVDRIDQLYYLPAGYRPGDEPAPVNMHELVEFVFHVRDQVAADDGEAA